MLLERDTVDLPSDVLAARALDGSAEVRVTSVEDIPPGWIGGDIGPQTADDFAAAVQGHGTIFWNGPMGAFEQPPFDKGTNHLATAVAQSPAFTVVGGGDTVSAIRQAGAADGIDHISTGGGAALELLAKGDLPGVQALRGDR